MKSRGKGLPVRLAVNNETKKWTVKFTLISSENPAIICTLWTVTRPLCCFHSDSNIGPEGREREREKSVKKHFAQEICVKLSRSTVISAWSAQIENRILFCRCLNKREINLVFFFHKPMEFWDTKPKKECWILSSKLQMTEESETTVGESREMND